MRNWGNLKKDCFNKRAQSLTELATFGSVLLIALSFFIRYGMMHNYQQDVSMRAFRMAMADAYTKDTPGADASLVLLEDKHIPDPQDMFGIGDLVSVRGDADVAWGNTMRDRYENETDLPTIKYAINDTEREYTTNEFGWINKIDHPDGFYIWLPGEEERVHKGWADVRCYWPSKQLFKQAMILVENDSSTDKDNETEVINRIALGKKGLMMPIIKIGPEDAVHGDPITAIYVLTPCRADIDPNYLFLNNDIDNDGTLDVNAGNVQGLLRDKENIISKQGRLERHETPESFKTISRVDIEGKDGKPAIIHYIKKNSGEVESIPYRFEKVGNQTWTTPK